MTRVISDVPLFDGYIITLQTFNYIIFWNVFQKYCLSLTSVPLCNPICFTLCSYIYYYPECIPDRQQDKNENENSDQVMTEANSMFKTS
jgi:hypothetical protein